MPLSNGMMLKIILNSNRNLNQNPCKTIWFNRTSTTGKWMAIESIIDHCASMGIPNWSSSLSYYVCLTHESTLLTLYFLHAYQLATLNSITYIELVTFHWNCVDWSNGPVVTWNFCFSISISYYSTIDLVLCCVVLCFWNRHVKREFRSDCLVCCFHLVISIGTEIYL